MDKHQHGCTNSKKKNRLSYSIMFKLTAVCFAEANGNRATARYLGINEKQIRDWRSKKLYLMQCDANAKRLKGAGRYPIRFKYDCKNSIKALQFKDSEKTVALDVAKQNSDPHVKSIEQGSNHHSHQHEIRYRNILPAIANNRVLDNGVAFNASRGIAQGKIKPKRESDFNEKISCALALLDLQTSKSYI
eukprot:gene14112-15587_t